MGNSVLKLASSKQVKKEKDKLLCLLHPTTMTMSDTACTSNADPTPVNESDEGEGATKQRTFPSLYDETIEISFMGVLVSGITE